MKKINYLKIVLDTLMALVFVLLFNKNAVAGLTFHEIAGLTIGLAFIIHIIINFKWVKQITSKFFKSKMNLKTRIGYIIDLLLLIDMAFIIGTGISISQVLFSGVFTSSAGNKVLHISLSYIALLLIGIHIGLHWSWVMNVFKNTFKITGKGIAAKIITAVLAALIFIFGSYNIYSSGYFTKIIPITSISPQGQPTNKIPSGGDLNPGSNNKSNSANADNSNNSANTNANTNSAAANNGNLANINDNSRPAVPNGENFKGPGGGRGQGGMKESSSSNIFSIIIKNLSIISFFSIITFYIEKLLKLKFKKRA